MSSQDGGPAWGSPSDGTSLEPPSPQEVLRRQAMASLRRKQEFRTHAVVYALVNLLLVVIWLVGAASSGVWFPWFVFPLFGWGIGLGVHGWATYGTTPITEDQVASEMERIARRRQGRG